jgi:hypothetical protein
MMITFYRDVKNDKGQWYESPLGRYTFRSGVGKQQALEYAIADFQKEFKVDNWLKIASGYLVS